MSRAEAMAGALLYQTVLLVCVVMGMTLWDVSPGS